MQTTLIVADTRYGKCGFTDSHIVGIRDAIVRACRQRIAVQRHADSWSQGLACKGLCDNVAQHRSLNASRRDGCRSCCLLSALSQLVVGDTRTAKGQFGDDYILVSTRVRISKGTLGRYSQIITTDDAAIHYLVKTQRRCCRTVIYLVLCRDATDVNRLLGDGYKHRFYFRVEMVGVAQYSIVNGVITCIYARGYDRLKGCIVKSVNQGASDSIACIYQLLSRLGVDKRLSHGDGSNLRRSLGNLPCPANGSLPCAASRNRYHIRIHISPRRTVVSYQKVLALCQSRDGDGRFLVAGIIDKRCGR